MLCGMYIVVQRCYVDKNTKYWQVTIYNFNKITFTPPYFVAFLPLIDHIFLNNINLVSK